MEDIAIWGGTVKADVTKWLENEDIRASHQLLNTLVEALEKAHALAWHQIEDDSLIKMK